MANKNQGTQGNGEVAVVNAKEVGSLIASTAQLLDVESAYNAAAKKYRGMKILVSEAKPAIGDMAEVPEVAYIVNSVDDVKSATANLPELRSEFAGAVLESASEFMESDAYETEADKLAKLREQVEAQITAMHELVKAAVKPFDLDAFVTWSPEEVTEKVNSTGGGKRKKSATKWSLDRYTVEKDGKRVELLREGAGWIVKVDGRSVASTTNSKPTDAVKEAWASVFGVTSNISAPREMAAAEQEARS